MSEPTLATVAFRRRLADRAEKVGLYIGGTSQPFAHIGTIPAKWTGRLETVEYSWKAAERMVLAREEAKYTILK